MSVTNEQLVSLYLAYFGRPPDIAGLRFYTTGDRELADVVRSFSASPESVALHGTTSFGAAQVNAIYQNLFNRDAEPAGLAAWQDIVNSGRISPAAAALAILQGAQNADRAAVENKQALARAFVTALDTDAEIAGYAGQAAALLARNFMKTVDGSSASLGNALAALQAQVNVVTGQVVAGGGGGGGSPPPVFAVAKDGSNVVSFTAPGAQVAVTESGGTFTFTSSGGTAGTGTAPAPIAGIVVPVATTLSISTTLASGKTFTGGGTALVVANAGGEDLTAFSATGATGFQLTSGQAYSLTAAQAAIGRIGAAGVAGALTDAGVTTVKDTLAALGGGVAATLKAAGVDSVIAAATTGADISATTVGGIDTLTLGAGNYTMTAAQASLADGTTGTQAVTLTTLASGVLAASVESFALGNFANTVTLGVGTQNVSSPAGTGSTLAIGGMVASGTWNLAHASGDTLVATTGASIAAVNGGNATSAERLTLDGTITMRAAQYTPLNNASLAAAGGSDRIILTSALSGGEILNAVVENFTLAAANYAVTLGATGQSIDADALTNAQTLTLAGSFAASVTLTNGNLAASSATGALTVTGGAGDNTITLGSGDDTVNAGGGADQITGGAGSDTLNGESGNDTFVYATMADFLSSNAVVDLINGGADTDTVVINAANVVLTTASNLARMTNVEQIKAQAQSATQHAHSVVVNSNTLLGGVGTIDLSGDTNSTSTATIDFTGVTNAMTLKGVGAGTNTITGGSGIDTLNGGSGNDTFLYATMADFLSSNAVVDLIDGGAGTDAVVINGESVVLTTSSNLARMTNVEQIKAQAQSATQHAHSVVVNSNTLLGGVGTIDLSGDTNSTSTATIDFTGVTNAMTLKGVGAGTNTITGGSGADTLVGGGGTNTVRGGGGTDTITALTGSATTYVFENTASANGSDNLVGVRNTSKFDFRGFLGASSVQTAAVDSTVGSVALDLRSQNIGVRYGSSALTTSDILLAANSSVAGEVVLADNGKAVVFSASAASSGVAANGSIYYVEDTNSAVGAQNFTVTLVGTMTLTSATVSEMALAAGYL